MDSIKYPIRLEKWITSKDGSGNNIEEITEKINLFAEVKRLSGDRASLNGLTNLDNIFQFIIRFTPKFDITGNWRIIYGGGVFTVHSIERVDQKRFWWKIKAEEKKGSGKSRQENFILTENGIIIETEDEEKLLVEV